MTTFKCPECGSQDLRVQVIGVADLIQDSDEDVYVGNPEGYDWDSDSTMECRKCGYECFASAFCTTKPHTVLLLYPDYMTGDYGRDFIAPTVEAESVEQAVTLAREEVAEECEDLKDPTDMALLAVLGGKVEFLAD